METLDVNEIINLLFVLSIAASVAGFMAGLLGVGGGIIIVPALYYAFTVLDFDIATRMHLSVGTSLAIIIPTSIISTKTHMEYDAVDFKLVKSFGIFILLGVIAGTFLAVNLKTPAFILFFSIMAFIVGLFFIFFREQLLKNPKMISDSVKNISGVIIGFISVLLGIGGGSTYLALLLIWEIPYYIFPIIALTCNIIVVSGNSFNYIKAGNLNLKLLIPYLLGSVPFAFIGGSLNIEKNLFEFLLFGVLSIAGFLLLIKSKSFDDKHNIYKKISLFFSIFIGSIIGFVSGIVGIGGGIFLSPVLFLLKAGKPKHIATVASLFILINSISGIMGQLTKNLVLNEIVNYWPLLLCVLFGGQLGNIINIKVFSNRVLALVTGILVIFVSIRLGFKIFS